MTKPAYLIEQLNQHLASQLLEIKYAHEEVTIELARSTLKTTLYRLKDETIFTFNQLIDVCGVDYLRYGQYDWETEKATEQGYSRGVEYGEEQICLFNKPRFAVVYHLLSTIHNHRLRVKVFLEENDLVVPSVCDIWKSANWFEREAYDLYGILFEGHPDLRRILTDYGFIGHPFRKDFPLSGYVEMRYDAASKQVIYEPVDIEPRITVPKVIRRDHRYLELQEEIK